MTVARLQQIHLYYSYAVLAVLLFILLKQDDFALLLCAFLSFVLQLCHF